MKNPPHIVIIGAGLMGLSTADSLLARGAKVTLIDKRSGPGQGASFCNSGMIHPSQAQPWRPGTDTDAARNISELAKHSRGLLKTRISELGLPSAKRSAGTMQLFDSSSTHKSAMQNSQDLGIGCKNITGEPFTFGRFALRFPGDGSGNAFEYCMALAADITRRGAAFIYSANMEVVADLAARADHVVIAAGAQSASLGRMLGIDLPIMPVTGHALNFALPGIALPDIPLMDQTSHSALTVFEDHVRLSGTVGEESPEVLMDIWQDIAPDLIDALGEPQSRWSGERPMCALGRPVIGPSGIAHIWINAGHAHMGWTLSAGSGDLMARMILDGHEDARFALHSKS